ncbi:hypothetical protein U1Q18_044619, partial [Sarracenia purpurea var. burkii]
MMRFRNRVCVPVDSSLREEILAEAHSSGYSIHPGSTKMVDAYPPGNRFLALSNFATVEDEVSRVPEAVAELDFGEQAPKSSAPTSALTVPSVMDTEDTEDNFPEIAASEESMDVRHFEQFGSVVQGQPPVADPGFSSSFPPSPPSHHLEEMDAQNQSQISRLGGSNLTSNLDLGSEGVVVVSEAIKRETVPPISDAFDGHKGNLEKAETDVEKINEETKPCSLDTEAIEKTKLAFSKESESRPSGFDFGQGDAFDGSLKHTHDWDCSSIKVDAMSNGAANCETHTGRSEEEDTVFVDNIKSIVELPDSGEVEGEVDDFLEESEALSPVAEGLNGVGDFRIGKSKALAGPAHNVL